ncbi:MAG: adenosine deaminase family protein [Kiritimatiellales bacterium]|nr:adenosine deaminase family protein [Kiritimatiellales bacterium]
MTEFSEQFIQKIPKTDLHLHLDGSLRLSTLIEFARQGNIPLPSYEEEGLNELVFKENYADLVEYLKGFAFTVGVLQTLENLERTAYELAVDSMADGVRYIEVRFAPQLHIATLPEIGNITRAVFQGLEKAKKEANLASAVVAGEDIPFQYGIILCALRRFNRHMSPYYAHMLKTKSPAQRREVYAGASLALVKEAVQLRDEGLPIVGFDLAGEEAGYPAIHHKDAFGYAHRHFLRKTVHAGEAYGPESIFQAITECHANRIGHGTFLFSEEAIKLASIKDKTQYIRQLSEYIANQRITIEVCPTSNLQTIPEFNSLAEHPIRRMIEQNLSVSVSTDNRLVSHTTVTNELLLLSRHIPLTHHQLRNIVLAGFKGAFFHAAYNEKRIYVRKAINRYLALEQQHFSENSS